MHTFIKENEKKNAQEMYIWKVIYSEKKIYKYYYIIITNVKLYITI